MRDSESLGRLLKAVHGNCNVSLVRFSKTECAEPNRLFITPIVSHPLAKRFASVAFVGSIYSKTKKGLSVQVTIVGARPKEEGRGKKREGRGRRSFDHYETTIKGLDEPKPCHLRYYFLSFKYKFTDR